MTETPQQTVARLEREIAANDATGQRLCLELVQARAQIVPSVPRVNRDPDGGVQ